jgi:predicted ATP-dependent serine protease
MLYGRLGEQERVRALLDAARDRRSGALLVVGEPGAGKSALLDEARAEARDMAALEARGVESESRLLGISSRTELAALRLESHVP